MLLLTFSKVNTVFCQDSTFKIVREFSLREIIQLSKSSNDSSFSYKFKAAATERNYKYNGFDTLKKVEVFEGAFNKYYIESLILFYQKNKDTSFMITFDIGDYSHFTNELKELNFELTKPKNKELKFVADLRKQYKYYSKDYPNVEVIDTVYKLTSLNAPRRITVKLN